MRSILKKIFFPNIFYKKRKRSLIFDFFFIKTIIYDLISPSHL